MKYIDIHCHLDSKDFDSDREAVLARLRESGGGAITIGATLEESKKAVEIAEANENVWATIGVHPEYLTSPRPPMADDPLLETGEGINSVLPLHLREGQPRIAGWDEVELEKLVQHPKVVAIGECGLEYFVMDKRETEKAQKELFKFQIEFAIKHSKPLMLHIRSSKSSQDAYNDALDILNFYKKEVGDKLRGNIHFFAGDTKIAQKFLDLDFTLSFTGVITFTHDYDEVIKYIPQNSIMSETDAPWVAPTPFRGKRNEPSYVVEVIKKMAEIRNENFDDLNNAILANARRVFLLPI